MKASINVIVTDYIYIPFFIYIIVYIIVVFVYNYIIRQKYPDS